MGICLAAATVAALLCGQANAFAIPSSVRVPGTNTVGMGASKHTSVSLSSRGPTPTLLSPRKVAASSYTVLFMGWGPEPEWSTASIVSNEAACPSGSCVSVTVSVAPEVAGEFKIPGQYVQMRQAGLGDSDENRPLFLAIASPPPVIEEADAAAGGGTSHFEFLIKKTDNNGWITNADPGTAIEISQVMGGGFPMEENFEGFKYDFPTQNILLFATGSGIAPIRSCIESNQLKIGDGRTARLYYGVTAPDEMPYVEKFGEWEAVGVEVVPVVSQPDNVSGGWSGRAGYVQTCLEEDGVPIPRNTGALMCGVKGMCESVKEILTQAGTFEGRVLTNF